MKWIEANKKKKEKKKNSWRSQRRVEHKSNLKLNVLLASVFHRASERVSGPEHTALDVFGKSRWWRATIEQSTYFFFFFFARFRLLVRCFVLSLQQQRQQQQPPLSAIHRMVCGRSRRGASTKWFKKISLVALCICPFDDDTYHLSLARIFSINVCRTKRSAKTKSIPCLLHRSPLRLDFFSHQFGRCGTATAQYVPLPCSLRDEHHGRTNNNSNNNK